VTLNQGEREPLPVEEQLAQIYAATNGFLDRINVERVPEFIAGLLERVRAQHREMLDRIAGGDWSDETQVELREAIQDYAQDFGYDLDEEGHPLEEAQAA
jgi:F-type H+-transporting ATPase subunit alpha